MPRWPVPRLEEAALAPVRSAAELTLVVNGSRMDLRVSMLAHGDSAFLADIYGPLGAHVAMVECDNGRTRVTAGGRVTEARGEMPLSALVDFGSIPFTFGDFVRILRGTYVGAVAPEGGPDSVGRGRREVTSVWRSDSVRRELVTGQRLCEVRSAAVESARQQNPWRLEFLRFQQHSPGIVRLTVDDRNYFVLRYRAGE